MFAVFACGDTRRRTALWSLFSTGLFLGAALLPGEGEAQDSRRVERDPEAVAKARILRERRASGDLPSPGDPAPNFRLKLLEGSNVPDWVPVSADGRVELAALRGKRPVALIFGSYT